MFALDASPAEVRPFEVFRSLAAEVRSHSLGSRFDVLQRPLDEIRVGDARYRLRSRLLATFYPRIHGVDGELVVAPCDLPVVGLGRTPDLAQRNWDEQFHVRFQTLLAKRPWEMTEPEKEEWDRIELMVDVAAYRRETPYRARQIGSISQRRPTAHEPRALPNQIRWESGKVEDIRLELAPPEFAALFAGRRFEAVVLRDSVTHRLLRILEVTPLASPPTVADLDDLWQSVPTSRKLPEEEWEKYD